MIDQIFVEQDIAEHQRVKDILTFFKNDQPILIDSIDRYFGKTKKPYLQKKTNLNIYIGTKKGQTVKLAPTAYGLSGESHFYFIHHCFLCCAYVRNCNGYDACYNFWYECPTIQANF